MDIFTLAGLVGFVGYLAPYVLLQLGRIDANGVAYTTSNVAAASLVLVGLIEQFNLAAALIQVAWIAVGLVGLVRRLPRLERARGRLQSERA